MVPNSALCLQYVFAVVLEMAAYSTTQRQWFLLCLDAFGNVGIIVTVHCAGHRKATVTNKNATL